jgi:hypothetical protein
LDDSTIFARIVSAFAVYGASPALMNFLVFSASWLAIQWMLRPLKSMPAHDA